MRTTLLAIATALAVPAAAAEKLVIVQPGYPGSNAEAQSFLSDLTGAIGGAGGPKLEGEYFNDAKEALEAITRDKPKVGVVSLGFYLAQREGMKLEPLLESRPPQRFYLAVKKGQAASLGDLMGKSVTGTAFQEPEFVARILFGPGSSGGPPAAGDAPAPRQDAPGKPAGPVQWKVVPADSFSKAVRDVSRGKADAVLLNERERQNMLTLTAGKELEVIWQSEPLPTAVVVAFGGANTTAQATAKALGALKDENLLEMMGLEGFTPVNRETMSKLEARFGPAASSTPPAPAGGR